MRFGVFINAIRGTPETASLKIIACMPRSTGVVSYAFALGRLYLRGVVGYGTMWVWTCCMAPWRTD